MTPLHWVSKALLQYTFILFRCLIAQFTGQKNNENQFKAVSDQSKISCVATITRLNYFPDPNALSFLLLKFKAYARAFLDKNNNQLVHNYEHETKPNRETNK